MLVVVSVAAATPFHPDPAPGAVHGRAWSRRFDCERMSTEVASSRYPGRIVGPAPRGDLVERSALACRERWARPGLREPREDAILSDLEDTATELTSAAAALRPDLSDRTWLVEAYYPPGPVGPKIAFATKNALMRGGLRVSDRAPALALGDVEVLGQLEPDVAYPAACQRYAAAGSLGAGDVLLAVVLRDPRETMLHGGLCDQGRWTWLR